MLAFFIGGASIGRLGAFNPPSFRQKNLRARTKRAFLCLAFKGNRRIGQAWRFCLKGRYALKAKMLKY